jgi:peptide deformylase
MKVVIQVRDTKGDQHRLEGVELLSRAMQHEIDHLDGILFIRHISALKRDLIRRKIRKLVKAGEWA